MNDKKTKSEKPELTDLCPICNRKFYAAHLTQFGTIIFIHTPKELAETTPIVYCKAPTSPNNPTEVNTDNKSGFQKQLEYIESKTKEELQ